MRNSGRVNFLTLGLGTMVVLVIVAFAFAREGLDSVGVRFMDALARHDVDQLVEMSYIGTSDPVKIEERKKKLRSEWDFAVNTAGKHYAFVWKVVSYTKQNETSGAVALKVTRNVFNGGYEEKFELPREQENGKWKVVVSGVSRDLFPALPN